MNLNLVISNNCNACKRVEAQLRQLITQNKDINVVVINIKDYKRRGIAMVPALLIEDELFAYGDIDKKKLLAKLK